VWIGVRERGAVVWGESGGESSILPPLILLLPVSPPHLLAPALTPGPMGEGLLVEGSGHSVSIKSSVSIFLNSSWLYQSSQCQIFQNH
jgi:hypothetical protein